MARPLVVEREAVTLVADPGQALLELDETQRRQLGGRRLVLERRAIGRLQQARSERVLDVRQQ